MRREKVNPLALGASYARKAKAGALPAARTNLLPQKAVPVKPVKTASVGIANLFSLTEREGIWELIHSEEIVSLLFEVRSIITFEITQKH